MNVAGPSGSNSNPGYLGTVPPLRQHSHTGHPVYHHAHNHAHLPSQSHTPLPAQQTQFVPSVPLQPLGTLESAKHVAATVKSLDFVGWNGELYVIVRGQDAARLDGNKVNANVGRASVGVIEDEVTRPSNEPDIDGTAGAGSSTTPAPTTPDIPSQQPQVTAQTATPAIVQQQPTPPQSSAGPTSCTSLPSVSQSTQAPTKPPSTMTPAAPMTTTVELKELPARRRLDCGKGVDLGGEDAVWLERRDVPMDYDMPVGGAAVEA